VLQVVLDRRAILDIWTSMRSKIERLPAHAIEDRLAREHTTGVTGQEQEDIELVAGERAIHATAADLPGIRVDLEATEAEHRRGPGPPARAAAHDRVEPGKQSRGSNGLGR
jgi:hypothetical protein